MFNEFQNGHSIETLPKEKKVFVEPELREFDEMERQIQGFAQEAFIGTF